MTVELFKDGSWLAIRTDAATEDDFVEQFNRVLESLIDRNEFEGDWAFQLGSWMPQFVDICCKYRGYKNGVVETKVLMTGSLRELRTPRPIASINDRGKVFYADIEIGVWDDRSAVEQVVDTLDLAEQAKGEKQGQQ